MYFCVCAVWIDGYMSCMYCIILMILLIAALGVASSMLAGHLGMCMLRGHERVALPKSRYSSNPFQIDCILLWFCRAKFSCDSEKFLHHTTPRALKWKFNGNRAGMRLTSEKATCKSSRQVAELSLGVFRHPTQRQGKIYKTQIWCYKTQMEWNLLIHNFNS